MNNICKISNNQYIYRLTITVLGVVLIGIAVAFFRGSGFGTDPFTSMNLAISKMLGSSLGVFQLKVNIGLFAIILIVARKYIGIGTIVNMVFVGFISDFFSLIIPNVYNIELRIMFTIIGVTVICLGVALYSSADFGVAPYDAIGWIVEDISNQKINFKVSRIVTDAICVLIGMHYGSVIGINTIIMVFFTGPLVQFFKQKICNLKK